MSLALPYEVIIEGVARAFTAWLGADPARGERILEKMAELRAELLTPKEAAAMLGITEKTLRANHVRYGFDKSTALGTNEPRYFRSQIVAAMKRGGVVVKGAKENVVPLPDKLRAAA